MFHFFVQDKQSIKVEASEITYTPMDFTDIYYEDDVEYYDYIHLIMNETPIFYNWINSLNYNLEDEATVAYIQNNYNKFILKAINLGIISDFRIQLFFSIPNHNAIITDSLNILYAEKLDAYSFFSNYSQILHSAAEAPDNDENVYASNSFGGSHYYVYGNGLSNGYYVNNYRDDILGAAAYSISARTRFEEHYSSAISLYKNGRYGEAMDSLGRALHYLQDIGSTPHSTGLMYKNESTTVIYDYHSFYENWLANAYVANTQNSPYIATSASGYYNSVLNLDNPSELLNDLAALTGQQAFKDKLTAVKGSVDDLNYAPYVEVASACIPRTQQYTAAILNRFYEDVKDGSTRYPNYIKHNGIYYVKNKGSEKYWDMESWGASNGTQLQFYNFHEDTNQQFKAVLNDDGLFYFKPVNANNKSIALSAVPAGSASIAYYLRLGDNGVKIKPVYFKNSEYRVMVEGEYLRYYKDVMVPVSNILDDHMSLDRWSPTNDKHYWYFEEVVNCTTGSTDSTLQKGEQKWIAFTPTVTGSYKITTTGNTDTYFESLSYRTGSGNSNIYTVISQPNDDGGNGVNAQYVARLEGEKKYLLCMRGYSFSTKGNFSVNISQYSPPRIQTSTSTIRTSTYTVTDNGRFTNPYDTLYLTNLIGQNVSSLKNNGYSSLEITITFSAWEKDDGYQYFFVYDGSTSSSNLLHERQFEGVPGSKSTSSKTYTFTVSLNLHSFTSDSLYVFYGASGSGADTWYNNNLKVSFTVT